MHLQTRQQVTFGVKQSQLSNFELKFDLIYFNLRNSNNEYHIVAL